MNKGDPNSTVPLVLWLHDSTNTITQQQMRYCYVSLIKLFQKPWVWCSPVRPRHRWQNHVSRTWNLSPNMVHHLLPHKIEVSVTSLTYLPSLIPTSTPVLQPREWPKRYLEKPACFILWSFCSCFLGLEDTSPCHLQGYILNSPGKTQLNCHLPWGRSDLWATTFPLQTSIATSIMLRAITRYTSVPPTRLISSS